MVNWKEGLGKRVEEVVTNSPLRSLPTTDNYTILANYTRTCSLLTTYPTIVFRQHMHYANHCFYTVASSRSYVPMQHYPSMHINVQHLRVPPVVGWKPWQVSKHLLLWFGVRSSR